MSRFRTALFVLLTTLSLAPGRVAAQVSTYHDVTGSQHQQQYNLLDPAGYRMIALSIYGDLNSPLYAAVWVQRPGPLQRAFHGFDAAQYQAWHNTWWAAGYRPRILTALGSGPNPRFAGVYELATNPAGWTLHGLTEAQFLAEITTARSQGLDVTAVDVYGTAADTRYIAAFGPVDAGQCTVISDDHSEYVEHFNALASGHARPVLVGFNDHGKHVSIWQSNDLSGWVAHSNMTSAQFQNQSNTYWGQGKHEISVQGSGAGSARRFAAVWGPSDLPTPPVFTMTGLAVPQLATYDTWVQNWMQQTETRAAALAIVKDARLVFARGYTNAPAGYPITQPTSLFETASNSKPITSIAMHQHFERPQYLMGPGDAMLVHVPSLVLDSRILQISLRSLLTHQGGWDRDAPGSFDPMFIDPTVATALNVSLPITKQNIFTYMMRSQLLNAAPDTQYAYSNFGFSILGLVLEANNPGMSYERIVDRDIFTPLGLSRPRLARSLRSGLWPGEVFYHPYVPRLAWSVMDDNQDWVPTQYGGANKENMDSHGGWVMAAPDFAKILAAFDTGASNPLLTPQGVTDMWTVEPGFATLTQGWRMATVPDGANGTVRMHHHAGRLGGAVSFIAKREDGLSFVFFTNGDKLNLRGDLHGGVMSAMANQITAWPTHDLFYSVGIPPFVHVAGALAPIGTGCRGSNGMPLFQATNVPDVGEVAGFLLTNGPSNSLGMMILGLQQTNTSLAPFGAPQCSVYTNSIATFFAGTNAAGQASFQWSTPPSPVAIGLTVQVQAAAFDPTANPIGIITTRGLAVTLGGWQ